MLPSLSRLTIRDDDAPTDGLFAMQEIKGMPKSVAYVLYLNDAWGINADHTTPAAFAGRGASAIAMGCEMTHGGVQYRVVVLVRPLDAYLADEDCNPLWLNPINANNKRAARFDIDGYCNKLEAKDYADEMQTILQHYDVMYTQRLAAGKKPLCPKLWHHQDDTPGVTTGYASVIGKGDLDKKPLFETNVFGVQVWERYDCSLSDYVVKYAGKTKLEHEAFKTRTFIPDVLPILRELCLELRKLNLRHADLHFGNVAARLDPADESKIVELVFIDISSVRTQLKVKGRKRVNSFQGQCDDQALIDELDFTW